jgi:hypothetical protein
MAFQFIRCTVASGVAAIAFAVSVPDASATVYRCTEAKDEAVLGADGSVSSSHGNRKCRWSVGGASTEKRPDANARNKEKTINAQNMLTTGQFNNLSRGSAGLRQFAELLIGPFDGPDIPSDTFNLFEDAVGKSASQFERCVGNQGRSGNFSERDILCTVITSDRDRALDLWSIEVLPTEPILAIGVIVRNQRFILFVPMRLMGRPQFR